MRKYKKRPKKYERVCAICGKRFKTAATNGRYCGKRCANTASHEQNKAAYVATRKLLRARKGPTLAEMRRQIKLNLAKRDEALKAAGYREPEVRVSERMEGGRRWIVESRGRCMGGWAINHAPANK